MSEILSLEQIEDEIGMLVRGGGDADRVLTQFMALSAALAAAESRLSRATEALREIRTRTQGFAPMSWERGLFNVADAVLAEIGK